MTSRTALLGLLAVILPAASSRADGPPKATGTVAPRAAASKGDRLAAPVLMTAAGKPLVPDELAGDPFVGDFDGDGVPDLLLGYGQAGRLLIHRNVGTKAKPKLGAPQWFDDAVPTGRIPKG
jgi:hypothetical protein